MGFSVPQLRFNDIADRILEYDSSCDLALLQRAYVFSAKVHEGQERLSGEPYLIHPLAVASILVDLKMDEVTVAAGLLHDTLEDTLTTAATVTSSMRRSTRIDATASGWIRYGSPERRSWPSWTFAENT